MLFPVAVSPGVRVPVSSTNFDSELALYPGKSWEFSSYYHAMVSRNFAPFRASPYG